MIENHSARSELDDVPDASIRVQNAKGKLIGTWNQNCPFGRAWTFSSINILTIIIYLPTLSQAIGRLFHDFLEITLGSRPVPANDLRYLLSGLYGTSMPDLQGLLGCGEGCFTAAIGCPIAIGEKSQTSTS